MNPIVIIPARMAAQRLPGKPLEDIGGEAMTVRVLRRALAADIGPVVVAAGDAEIVDVVQAAGGHAVLTDPALPSGSPIEPSRRWPPWTPRGAHDVVINLQGDKRRNRPSTEATDPAFQRRKRRVGGIPQKILIDPAKIFPLLSRHCAHRRFHPGHSPPASVPPFRAARFFADRYEFHVRSHLSMKKTQCKWLAMLFLAQAACVLPLARAGFDLKDTSDSKGSVDEGDFSRKKFVLSGDVRFGYDDNPLAQPDHVTFVDANGALVRRGVNIDGSAFVNADVGATYTLADTRFSLAIQGDVGATYYFDREGRNYDINGGLTLSATYKVSPRLFLEVTSYNAYISQGDYGATNLTGFNTVVGTAGRTSADINGDYFYTTDGFGLTFTLSPRVSLVTGGSFVAFAFDDAPYSTDQDRIELYFSEEFRYLVTPVLTLAADYRFGYIDYFSVSNDSYTNFLLAGFDYVFNPRLRGSVRAGVEFRTYVDSPGDETSPYAEATITYDVSRKTNVSLTARYGIEEGDLSTDVTKADTVRLGINAFHQFTPRISVYGGFYFTHAYYSTPDPTDPSLLAIAPQNFNEETYDVSAGARYAINRNFAVEIGYTHTTVSSGIEVREYDRNRYFGGLRFQF